MFFSLHLKGVFYVIGVPHDHRYLDVNVSMATYVTKGVTFFFFSELLKTIPERGRKKKWKNGPSYLM